MPLLATNIYNLCIYLRPVFVNRSIPKQECRFYIELTLTLPTTLPHASASATMCTEVYTIFSDPECTHKEYQNTFPCHVVRRCNEDDDQLLREPVFLPTRPPNIPPGFLGCKVRKATRPVAGKCRACRKKHVRTKQGNNSVTEATTPSSNSASSLQSSSKRTPALYCMLLKSERVTD